MINKIIKKSGILATVAAVLMVFSVSSQAVLITQTVTDQGGGVFEIAFTVENTSSSPIDDFIVFFDASVASLVENASFDYVSVVPTDWIDNSDGGFITPTATVFPSFGAFTDILMFETPNYAPIGINEILSGFSILVNAAGSAGLSSSFDFEAYLDLQPIFSGTTTSNAVAASAPSVIGMFIIALVAGMSRRKLKVRKNTI